MMQTIQVAVVVGSLRKGSYSRMLAKALMDLSPPGFHYEIAEIGALPMFDQDIESQGEIPDAWARFRARIKAVDAVLFVTPEYNRSIPGVLKNAIDVGSRPYGQSAWNGKPAAVVSNTPGGMGGFGANHHLRQVLTFLNMPILQQPEAYIGHVNTLFDEQGHLQTTGSRDYLRAFMQAFADWIIKVAPRDVPVGR